MVQLYEKLVTGLDEQQLSLLPCVQLSPEHFTRRDQACLPAILLDSLARYQKWDKVVGSAEGIPSARAILAALLVVLHPKQRMRLVMRAHQLYTIPVAMPHPTTGKMMLKYYESHLRYLQLHKPTMLSVSLDAD